MNNTNERRLNIGTRMRPFSMRYRLPRGNDPIQETVVQATTPDAARKILKQMITGVHLVSAPKELK